MPRALQRRLIIVYFDGENNRLMNSYNKRSTEKRICGRECELEDNLKKFSSSTENPFLVPITFI